MLHGVDDLREFVRAARRQPLRVALFGSAAILVGALSIISAAALGVFGEKAVEWVITWGDPPQEPDKEVEFWRSVKESQDLELLKLYIEKFPNGLYVPLAEKTINYLMHEQHLSEFYSLGIIIDDKQWLMWTKEDNGLDQSWTDASKYCRDLIISTYDDWRLPTSHELKELYDPSNIADVFRLGDKEFPIKIRQGFLLSIPWIWNTTSGSMFEFDTGYAYRGYDPSGNYRIRTLCVREYRALGRARGQ